MRRPLFGWLAATALAATLGAQEPGAPPRPKELTELVSQFEAESARYQAATKALVATDEYKKAAEARDREKIDALRKTLTAPDRDAYADKAFEAAAKLKGDDRARTLIWSLTISPKPEKSNRAVDALLGEFSKAPVMIELCEAQRFAYAMNSFDPAKAGERLKKMADDAATPQIKAWALYADGLRVKRDKTSTDEAKAQAEAKIAEAAKLAAGTELGDRIGAPTFEKERLQIGMVAPDIEGKDLDGKPFKLSDYRGKVVVLDFWGDW